MTPSRLLARTALAAWLLGNAGCSLVLKTDSEQCTVTADCTARGSAFANTVCSGNVCVASEAGAPDPKWGCIGDVPALPSGGMTTFTAQFLDIISNAPVTQGLALKLCSKVDPACTAPLACNAAASGCTSPLASLTPDSMGNVSGMVASDFGGYLDVTDTTGTYPPSLVFIDLVAMTGANAQVLLVTKSLEMTQASNAGLTLDASDALILMPVVDCTNTRTAGASAALSPAQAGATQFYEINTALVTTATQTDSSGNAGFANVPPGTVSIVGTVVETGVPETGKEFGKVTTLVRAGTVTYQFLRPTTNL